MSRASKASVGYPVKRAKASLTRILLLEAIGSLGRHNEARDSGFISLTYSDLVSKSVDDLREIYDVYYALAHIPSRGV